MSRWEYRQVDIYRRTFGLMNKWTSRLTVTSVNEPIEIMINGAVDGECEQLNEWTQRQRPRDKWADGEMDRCAERQAETRSQEVERWIDR